MPMLPCSACAPVVTKIPVPGATKADAVPVTDLRLASEKKRSGNSSLLIASKRYGILRRTVPQLQRADRLRRSPMCPLHSFDSDDGS